MNYVTVLSRRIQQDKREKNFAVITLEQKVGGLVVDHATGESSFAFAPSKTTTMTAWENSYLNDQPEFGWDAEVGTKLLGSIVTRQVEEYTIPGNGTPGDPNENDRVVSTYSTFVPGDTSSEDYELNVRKAFKAAQHTIVSSNAAQPAIA